MNVTQDCRVCGKSNCNLHLNEKVVLLSKEFVDLLVEAPSYSIPWSKFLIKADTPTPLAVWVNPPGTPLLGTPFWAQKVHVTHKSLNHIALRLIRAKGPPNEMLSYKESISPIFVKNCFIRGKSPRGYFVVYGQGGGIPVYEAKYSQILNLDGINVIALSRLAWVKSETAGVFRQTTYQNRRYKVYGESLNIYDHRKEQTPLARVLVTQKEVPTFRWRHMNLYPPETSEEVGFFLLGEEWMDIRKASFPGYEIKWSFVSTSVSEVSSSSLIMSLYLSTKQEEAVERISDLEDSIKKALEEEDYPRACLELEDLIVELLGNGTIEVSTKTEKLWSKYLSIKARALKTNFEGEAKVAWKKGAQILQKLRSATK